MTTEIKTPTFPESVADGTVATWYKKPGDAISRDDLIVDIETDKVVLEVVASADGVLKEIIKGEGEVVLSAEVLGFFEAGAVASAAPASEETKTEETTTEETKTDAVESVEDIIMSPAARKMAAENSISANDVKATGKDGRITKEDIVKSTESDTRTRTCSCRSNYSSAGD
jgi:2-oxoglutarate dehydrogenase E2 component (dihydrolipoamide succinyltransferase)